MTVSVASCTSDKIDNRVNWIGVISVDTGGSAVVSYARIKTVGAQNRP